MKSLRGCPASMLLRYPSPVHTIALTEKYIVMIQIPYPLNWAESSARLRMLRPRLGDFSKGRSLRTQP